MGFVDLRGVGVGLRGGEWERERLYVRSYFCSGGVGAELAARQEG